MSRFPPPIARYKGILVAGLVGLLGFVALLVEAEPPSLGFKDTPMLPGGLWHVHDSDRPQPVVVTPGAALGQAPSDAIMLFDGHDLSAFTSPDGSPPSWRVEAGAAIVPQRLPGMPKVNLQSRENFGDMQLHLEFRSPEKVVGTSQERGNSGVFFMGLYELQILDSYDNPTFADGAVSSLFGWKPPLVNASKKPGQWQNYDIIFERPHFEADGKLSKPATVTVLHNGVLTQNHQAFLGKTDYRIVASYKAHADALPLQLQDHGEPVAFRNIWVRRLKLEQD